MVSWYGFHLYAVLFQLEHNYPLRFRAYKLMPSCPFVGHIDIASKEMLEGEDEFVREEGYSIEKKGTSFDRGRGGGCSCSLREERVW